jgi:hypothetical protein
MDLLSSSLLDVWLSECSTVRTDRVYIKKAGPWPLQRRFDSGYYEVRRQSELEEEAEPFLYQHKKGRHLRGKREEPGAIGASRRLPMTDAQEEVPFSFPSAR